MDSMLTIYDRVDFAAFGRSVKGDPQYDANAKRSEDREQAFADEINGKTKDKDKAADTKRAPQPPPAPQTFQPTPAPQPVTPAAPQPTAPQSFQPTAPQPAPVAPRPTTVAPQPTPGAPQKAPPPPMGSTFQPAPARTSPTFVTPQPVAPPAAPKPQAFQLPQPTAPQTFMQPQAAARHTFKPAATLVAMDAAPVADPFTVVSSNPIFGLLLVRQQAPAARSTVLDAGLQTENVLPFIHLQESLAAEIRFVA